MVMDPTPTHRCTVQRPFFLLHPTHHHHHLCHHHHHHFLCFCPHHHHHHFNGHPHLCPTLISPFPRNPEASNPVPLPNHSNLETSASGCEQSYATANLMLQEQEHEGLEEEDDDEPVFVLTDEWREFFAKSEAKRKLGKVSLLLSLLCMDYEGDIQLVVLLLLTLKIE
ncbi:uncharacterized protein LOC112033904 isoform X1 [Quercus suber]|uniref:uncharacterized protein LOC112033904 isoform X1 n=1 Tax=Quercus suber TaxID=58331 RepID=UPI0032DE3888